MIYKTLKFGFQRHAPTRGAALVVALSLLSIVSLLALTGMARSTLELVMASNELHRMNAKQAASAGIEAALARLQEVARDTAFPSTASREPMTGEGRASGSYSTITRLMAIEQGVPRSSADRFAGLHYVVESIGRSHRGAEDAQVQGARVIVALDDATTLTRIDSGLSNY